MVNDCSEEVEMVPKSATILLAPDSAHLQLPHITASGPLPGAVQISRFRGSGPRGKLGGPWD